MARARQAAHNAPVVIMPQGRLTLTTATPVMTSEAASQTTVYYTPYVGDCCPLYNGTEWENKLFTELSISMAASANWAASKNFDLFVYNDAGTLRLVTGAAWTNDTTRAEALVLTNGIWLNNVSFTGRYAAASTVSIAASRATYVGTMRTTSSAGTTTWELGGSAAGGDPVRYFLWNAYNRQPVNGWGSDSTASWTYSATAHRSFNNNTNNRLEVVNGDAGWSMEAVAQDMLYIPADSRYGEINLPKDSTTTPALPGVRGALYAGGVTDCQTPVRVSWIGAPGIGYHYFQLLEAGHTSGFGFYGGNNHLMYINGAF